MKAYKTRKRIVWTKSLGRLQAIEHQKICPNHRKDNDGKAIIYRPEELTKIVRAGWNFSDEIMWLCAHERFIKGRSESEIVKELMERGIAISRQEVSRLSRIALRDFSEIHMRRMSDIKSVTEKNGGYFLHIDGTLDGDYSVLIACYDSISDILLYAMTVDTESYENVKPALDILKNNLGVPLAAITDLGSQIRAAVRAVFPGIKIVACRFHFLRDLGRDILDAYYRPLVKSANNLKIISGLNRLLKDIEKTTGVTRILRDLKSGYISSHHDFYKVLAWLVLKDITSYKEGAGYGYPFDLPILKFVTRCNRWCSYFRNKEMKNKEIQIILKSIKRVGESEKICELAKKVADINGLFEELRKAMRIIDDKIPLSAYEQKESTERVHQQCNDVIETMEAYLSVATMPQHIHTAVKHIIMQYRKWENDLFVPDIPVTIEGKKNIIKLPTTNNQLEAIFRNMRRSFRRHGGDKNIGKKVTDIGRDVLLFQNSIVPQYVKQLFGGVSEIPNALREVTDDREMKTRKITMRQKERDRAIKYVVDILDSVDSIEQIPVTPYTDELWNSLAMDIRGRTT